MSKTLIFNTICWKFPHNMLIISLLQTPRLNLQHWKLLHFFCAKTKLLVHSVNFALLCTALLCVACVQVSLCLRRCCATLVGFCVLKNRFIVANLFSCVVWCGHEPFVRFTVLGHCCTKKKRFCGPKWHFVSIGMSHFCWLGRQQKMSINTKCQSTQCAKCFAQKINNMCLMKRCTQDIDYGNLPLSVDFVATLPLLETTSPKVNRPVHIGNKTNHTMAGLDDMVQVRKLTQSVNQQKVLKHQTSWLRRRWSCFCMRRSTRMCWILWMRPNSWWLRRFAPPLRLDNNLWEFQAPHCIKYAWKFFNTLCWNLHFQHFVLKFSTLCAEIFTTLCWNFLR